MKLFRRLALITLVVVLLVGIGVYVAARYYLSSNAMVAQVSTRLEAMFGAPVEVDTADVGMTGSSSLHGLRVFEAGDEAKQTPIVSVDGASADIAAVDLLAGKSPNEITLTGASIVLHFDAQGALLTHLPKPKTGAGPMPHLHIDNGKLTLNQDGRPPMVVQGIKVDLGPYGADMKADGSVADPFWGDWSLTGSVASETGTVSLTLAAKDVSVDKAHLTALPFVSPDVWQEVMVEGKTSCDFDLHFALQDHPAVHYRVACAPDDARVHIASIELDADRASGKVVVEDNLVQLRDVHGRFAGGEMRTEADLDFRERPWRLKFPKIEADKVVVHDLPRLWMQSLKDKIDGELTGKADVEVSLGDAGVHVSGTGEGQIDKATVAGFPASEPIELALVTEDGRLKIRPRESVAKLAMAFLTPAMTAAPPPPPPPPTAPPPPVPEPTPTGVLSWLPNAAVWMTNQGADALSYGLSTAAGWLGHPKSGPAEETSYLTAKLTLQDVDLGELLRRLEVKLPFPVEGKLSFQVETGIPINTPQDMKAYRLNGTADLPRLNIAGVEMADVHSRIRYDNGVLELQELKGKAVPTTPTLPHPRGEGREGGDAAGTFEGTARMEVAPMGDLSGDLKVDRFPLDMVLSRLPGAGGMAAGTFSGHVEARAPAKTLTDPSTWHATGSLTSDRIEVYGQALTAASADVSVDAGTAKASNLKATLDKAPLVGDAHLRLSAPWDYAGTLTLKGADLAAVQRLAPDFRPPFAVQGAADVTADLKGTLTPLSVTASGTANGTDLTLGQFKADSLSFKWDMDGDHVKLTDAKAKLYGGEASGSAVVPLRAAEDGAVDVRLDGVDVQALAKSLPALPLQLQGKATGTIKATLPASGADGERQATAKIDLSAKAMRVQNIPTDNMHADVDYKDGVAAYQIKGDSLGGHFTLEGKVPLTEEKKAAKPGGGDGAPADAGPPESSGRFRFEGIRLSRLWEALNLGSGPAPLRGRADIDLPFRFVGPDNTPAGAGTLRVRNLRIGDTLLAESLSADLLLRGQTVQIRNLSATVGEGAFRGVVVYNYHDPDRSYFNLTLEQVDVASLLAPYPNLAAQIDGPVDLRVRGNLGRTWHGSGEATLTRGRVFGAVVDEWHVPLSFEFSPERGSGLVRVSDSYAQLAGGRATGQAELHWAGGEAPRLEGNARFSNAEVRSLVRPGGSLGSYLVGRVTGRVDFGAESLRSADDLTATLAATLSDSQALQIPVLSAVAPYLAPGQSATTFQSGEVRGRLARGVFRLQRLNLSSALVRMTVVGTITTQGRLDLDVTGGTSQLGYNPASLRLLGLRIPAVGPIPVAILLEASSYLSNRVINLRITGTVRNPDVRLQPVAILAEEAVRFFVLQSGVPAP